MTSTARNSHDQQPGRHDMNKHQRTACRTAAQEQHAAGEAAHRRPPGDPAAACQPARASGTDGEPARYRCQQCGGINTTTGTICDQCTAGLLAGQFIFAHRCEQCGQPAGIAGRYCSGCLPSGPAAPRH